MPEPSYRNHIIPAVCRLFGSLNRTPGSPSEGSLSRDAWHYRFGGRFHSPTRQSFLYTLVRLYEEPGSPFHGNPEVLNRIRTVLDFTPTLQNRDGSFPEWYRGQSSYCSTAYLSAYLSEALLRMARTLDGPVLESAERSLASAARRLSRPASDIPSNQLAAGILALWNCATLLGGSWNREARALRDRLLASEGERGWFPEYGGPDLGYQTLTLDFLTRCAERGLDGLAEGIRRGISFLDRFVMPDGTAPPGLSRRGTSFLMPYALERWAPSFGPAADLSRRVRGALEGGRLPSPVTADDRYSPHLFLPSFVDAQFAGTSHRRTRLTVPISGREPAGPDDGGLRAYSGDAFFCILQERTGSVSVYSRKVGKVVLEGPVYRMVAPGGTFTPVSSGAFRYSEGPEYHMESFFRKSRGEGGAVWLGAALLSALAPVCGRIHPRIPPALDSVVRRYAFGTGREAPIRFRRSIFLGSDRIRIHDSIDRRTSAPGGRMFCTFRPVPSAHPSSGFHTPRELDGGPPTLEGLEDAVREAWASGGSADLEAEVSFEGSGVRFRGRVNGKEIGEEAPLAGLLR